MGMTRVEIKSQDEEWIEWEPIDTPLQYLRAY